MGRTSTVVGVRGGVRGAVCAAIWAALAALGAAPAGPDRQVAAVAADDRTATFVGEATWQVSLRQAARRFYADQPDRFDVLVVAPAFRTTASGGALYEAVQSDTLGLNADQGGMSPATFDLSADYGSARLKGVIQLGDLADLPEDPGGAYVGGWSVLDVLCQELAHRHGAFVRFRGEDGRASDALLGADGGHWSFFVDTGGSPLGGNAWVAGAAGADAAGPAVWRTAPPSGRFHALDLYLMGLLPAAEVGAVRLLRTPEVLSRRLDPRGRPYDRDSLPGPGVEVRGAWLDVPLQAIVAVEGERRPPSALVDPVVRVAFTALFREGEGGVEDAALRRLDDLRAAWQARWQDATGGRGRLVTRLDGRDDLPAFPRDLLRHGFVKDAGGAWVHEGLAFPAWPDGAAAVAGRGRGLLRFRAEGGAGWSDGAPFDAPALVDLSADPAWSGGISGLRLDPLPGVAPPRVDGLRAGPRAAVAPWGPAPPPAGACACRPAGVRPAAGAPWRLLARRG